MYLINSFLHISILIFSVIVAYSLNLFLDMCNECRDAPPRLSLHERGAQLAGMLLIMAYN